MGQTMALTELQCKKAEAKEKQYRLSDSNGLSLIVDPNGQKYWSVRFTINGSRKSKALGKYPEVSLKLAREYAYELKHTAPDDKPIEPPKPLFKEVGEAWFNNQKDTWSGKHIKNVRASLDELYVVLGGLPVDKITAPEILQAIKKIEARGSLEIAKRTLSRCGMVMKYSIAHGYRFDNPANDLVYALKPQKTSNLAALPAKDMPTFLAKVKSYRCHPQIQHAIMIIMLTGVRVSELLNARWEEFDFNNKTWDIPEERMKNRLPHRVPLSDLAIKELVKLRQLHKLELLFPNRLDNKKPMTSESILQVIKRSGYAGEMTTHGFRSLFSTLLNESNLFNPDAIERQLAHVPQNRIRAAYNRALYWDERVRMMDWYETQVKKWLSPQ
jgi:integrase